MAIGMTSAVYLTGAKEEISITAFSGCFAVKTLRAWNLAHAFI